MRYTDDDYDGIQYDTEYDPSPGQLEADQIRRECLDVSGVIGADGNVYSDADPGL